jgi:hypothetical protein
MMINHEEVDIPAFDARISYKLIQPEIVPFISHPFEWSFSQLKDAALLTLEIHKRALQFGMILKDASAYNVQFLRGRPVLIDSLSFEIGDQERPWTAYRQFCQHFLAPLALMVYTDVRLNQLFRVYIDGCPLDLASKLLPRKSYLKIGVMSHIHLHARAQNLTITESVQHSIKERKTSRMAHLGIIESLQSTIQGLKWAPKDTAWVDYYDSTNYSSKSLELKKTLVAKFIDQVKPETTWDLGANTGVFSRLAAQAGSLTISCDIDPGAVEKNYLEVKTRSESLILPLCIDLTNPSPAMGWENLERNSFLERGPVDLVMALALIHHLAISNNVPLEKLASFFGKLGRWLIIEFVPKEDSQVKKLLTSRVDIFTNYSEEGFEKAFLACFDLISKEIIEGSERKLFLLKSRTI